MQFEVFRGAAVLCGVCAPVEASPAEAMTSWRRNVGMHREFPYMHRSVTRMIVYDRMVQNTISNCLSNLHQSFQ
jgi:hypothetical protein